MTDVPVVKLKTVIRSGSPQIYKKMVRKPERGIEAGSVVRVEDRHDRFVGYAFFNPRSELALRVITRDPDQVPGDAWFRRAVSAAVALRTSTLRLDRQSDAWRAVFSEADRLPGLIVDRYGDVLSCQVSSLGIYRNFEVIREQLQRELAPKAIHVASEPRIAKIEGFPASGDALDSLRVTITENGLDYEVDCARGHKTGFFLDQRRSRLRVRELARGRHVLDLFSYTGGFALNAARGGAEEVVAVDLDEDAIAQAKHNARMNRMDRHVKFVHADAFDVLRSLRGGEYDLMVVDPAKQCDRKADLENAMKYYEDLNTLAFGKVAKGGLVLACSCTGMVAESMFLAALGRASQNVRRQVTFLEMRGAPPDHPVLANFPQARYLKCILCLVE